MNIHAHAAQRDEEWHEKHPGQVPDYGERNMRAEALEELADCYNYVRHLGLPQSQEELIIALLTALYDFLVLTRLNSANQISHFLFEDGTTRVVLIDGSQYAWSGKGHAWEPVPLER